jgi:hypothetical protein
MSSSTHLPLVLRSSTMAWIDSVAHGQIRRISCGRFNNSVVQIVWCELCLATTAIMWITMPAIARAKTVPFGHATTRRAYDRTCRRKFSLCTRKNGPPPDLGTPKKTLTQQPTLLTHSENNKGCTILFCGEILSFFVIAQRYRYVCTSAFVMTRRTLLSRYHVGAIQRGLRNKCTRHTDPGTGGYRAGGERDSTSWRWRSKRAWQWSQ